MADRWALNWDTLAAIGTLALAIATGLLARSTERLARSSAAELRERWRPLLLPARQASGRAQIHLTSAFQDREELWVRIANGGPGPALYVRALLDPVGASPANWDRAALGPGDEVALRFVVDKPYSRSFYRVRLDYRDLFGRTWGSALIISVGSPGDDPVFYDVKIFDRAITPHGDSLEQVGLDPLEGG